MWWTNSRIDMHPIIDSAISFVKTGNSCVQVVDPETGEYHEHAYTMNDFDSYFNDHPDDFMVFITKTTEYRRTCVDNPKKFSDACRRLTAIMELVVAD